MCVLCRRYAQQTQVVAALAHRLARPDAAGGPDDTLPPELEQKLGQLTRPAGHPGWAASQATYVSGWLRPVRVATRQAISGPISSGKKCLEGS